MDAGDLGEGHVVEGTGGRGHGEVVGLFGGVKFAEDGEGVAAHDGGLAAEVVVGVLGEPGGDIGGGAAQSTVKPCWRKIRMLSVCCRSPL